jgi:exopolyphosphatase/guanosine-5'-triphosphate,3'-diphosphate pyrophosphatase
MGPEKVLILDIGGGSNEFIIGNKEKIHWKGSFETGIARVLEKFHPSDPLTTTELEKINAFFIKEHGEVSRQSRRHGVKALIGSSGSFDTFTALTHDEPYTYDSVDNASSRDIDLDRYRLAHGQLLSSTREQRLQMKGMDRMRVEMIPVASLLLSTLLANLRIERLIQSEFAMKEGVLWELMNGEELLRQII